MSSHSDCLLFAQIIKAHSDRFLIFPDGRFTNCGTLIHFVLVLLKGSKAIRMPY
jgi:hypothetical protein